MTRWLLPLMTILLLAPAAAATDYELDANLVSPVSGQAYINIADCDDPDALELRASWSVPAGVLPWVGTQAADVFISVSETCSSVSFEIGDVAGEGTDLDVDEIMAEQEIKFPATAGETYTLADLVEDSGMTCGSGVENDYYLCIDFEYEYSDIGGDRTDRYYGGAAIRIDFTPPAAPTLDDVLAGEENLKVQWTVPDDDDRAGYYVYYRVAGSDGDYSYVTVTGADANEETITGLTNGTTYEVRVSAYDEAYNEGEASEMKEGTPEPINDFYEYYRGAEGGEDGGFCFVATAAYGAYGDAMVRELRGFRDEVLAESEAGRGFIAGYYRFGPRWARAIRHDPASRNVAKTGLLPLVGLASLRHAGPAEWILLLSGLALLGWLAVRFRRWLAGVVRRASVAGLVLAVGLGVLAASPQASAQEMSSISSSGVIHPDPRFQLQVRLGPYAPSVDSESGLTGTPFKDIFGSKSELLFEFDLDYEIWRGFGVFTAGASFGFVQFLGKGRTESGTKSSDTTVLNLVPLRLTVGYHFTKLDEWWDVPVVPYVHGGLSYYIWWVTDGVGGIAKAENDSGGTSEALGGIFGLHFGVGLKLLLDWMDPDAAAGIENELGVINTFLFAEYSYSWVDGLGIGDHMSLGDATGMFGLMFEF